MDGKTLGEQPVNVLAARDARNIHNDAPWGSEGITLRQHYAGLAMQGILANRVYDPPRRTKLAMMAVDAVAAADHLLAALTEEAK